MGGVKVTGGANRVRMGEQGVSGKTNWKRESELYSRMCALWGREGIRPVVIRHNKIENDVIPMWARPQTNATSAVSPHRSIAF